MKTVDHLRSIALASPTRRAAARWLLVIICGSTAAPLAAQSLDERFLDGLRQRQLFSLADKFCRDALAKSDLSEARRAALSIELSRCLAEEALQSSPEKRDPLWTQALAAVDDVANQYPKNPRLVQTRVQRGLVQLTWGELLAQEAEATGNSPDRVAAARDHLREAIEELQKGAGKTAELLRRQQPGRRAETGELTSGELRSLEKNIQYQLARALRSQGESYPVESADRTNSLTQAVELLRSLGQGDAADPLTWPSRVDAALCYRLLGHHEAAARRLDSVDSETPPPRVELRARAERIRLELAEGHVAQAVALAEKSRMLDGRALADLDFAALEAYLAAWRAAADAGGAAQASSWQAKASATVREIEHNHDPYWSRRAESLFAEQVAANPTTTDVAVLARAAEGFYRAGQADEALQAYDRAVREARNSGQDGQAFDLAYAAAAIEQERKHFAAAADRLRQAALATPTLAKAAEAHLLAVYDLGQQARNAPAEMERYVAALEEHLKTWPTAKSADRAHLWLARVFEHDRHWPHAIEQYAAVRAESEAAPEAPAGLARCYQAQLSALRAAGKPTSATATAAVAAIEALSGITKLEPRQWNEDQRRDALAVATMLLEYTDDGFAKAERLLQPAVDQATDAPEDWKSSARALLVYSIAAQGRNEDAQRLAENMAGAGPKALQTLADGLDRLCQTAQPQLRRNLATLALRVLDMMREQSAESTGEERRAMSLARARALTSAGREADAISALKKLADEQPRDGQIQEALALSLYQANDPAALAAWQNVVRKSRSGSERWLRGKLHEALIYERSGEKQRAVQAVNVVKTLYPEMGGQGLKRQFLEILQRCQ